MSGGMTSSVSTTPNVWSKRPLFTLLEYVTFQLQYANLFEANAKVSAGSRVNDRCAVVVVVYVAVPTAVHRNIVTMERSFTVRSTW